MTKAQKERYRAIILAACRREEQRQRRALRKGVSPQRRQPAPTGISQTGRARLPQQEMPR